MILVAGREPEAEDDPRILQARSGWRIPCKIPTQKMTAKLMQIHAQELINVRGNLSLRSIDHYPYNCMGMVFAGRRAWIDLDEMYRIFKEDDYTRIQRNDVHVSDVVVYRLDVSLSHVGLITQVNQIGREKQLIVASKWGLDPEFIHEERNVP